MHSTASHLIIDTNVTNVASGFRRADRRLRGWIAGVRLLQIGEKGNTLLQELGENPELLVNTLYALCKPAADQANITDEQFGEAMGGQSIDDATQAFMKALADFFPIARRTVLRRAIAKLEELRGLASDKGLSSTTPSTRSRGSMPSAVPSGLETAAEN